MHIYISCISLPEWFPAFPPDLSVRKHLSLSNMLTCSLCLPATANILQCDSQIPNDLSHTGASDS